jgi:pyroglutamyl-peptidase
LRQLERKAVWLWFLQIVCLLSFGCSSPAPKPRAPKPLILVTAFEPFAGRRENLSYDVALELASMSDKIGSGAEIRICRLPVVYDKAAERTLDCLAGLRRTPTLVLSLGEGGCRISLETLAHNVDDVGKLADNEGHIRVKSEIVKGSPALVSLSFPARDMFCTLTSEDRRLVAPSASAGAFVCNNTAYHLAFEMKGRNIPYGFIHVPPASCAQGVRDVRKNAGVIARLLTTALAVNRDPAAKHSVSDECRKSFDWR